MRDPESDTALRLRAAGAELVVGDLATLDAAGFKAVVDGTAAVIHLAATFRDSPTPERANAVNTDASTALAEAALEAGVTRFVFASTNLVYGGGHTAPQDERRNWGRSLGRAVPGVQGRGRELVAGPANQRGLDLRVVRLAFVYGDGDPHIEEFMKRPLDWHPSRRLQMVHHADVAQGLMLALRAERPERRDLQHRRRLRRDPRRDLPLHGPRADRPEMTGAHGDRALVRHRGEHQGAPGARLPAAVSDDVAGGGRGAM